MTVGSMDDDVMMMSAVTYIVGQPFVSSFEERRSWGSLGNYNGSFESSWV